MYYCLKHTLIKMKPSFTAKIQSTRLISKMKKDSYSNRTKKNNHYIKIECNDYIAQHTNKHTTALILDADDCFTSKSLYERGVNPHNIHVPNMSYETYNKIKKQKYSSAYNVSLYQFLKFGNPSCSYNNVWLDYCATWKSVKSDIDLFFSKKCLSSNGMFSITLSMRKVKNSLQKHRCQIINYIKRIANINGYDLECDESNSYFYGKNRNMDVYEKDVVNSYSMLFLSFFVVIDIDKIV